MSKEEKQYRFTAQILPTAVLSRKTMSLLCNPVTRSQRQIKHCHLVSHLNGPGAGWGGQRWWHSSQRCLWTPYFAHGHPGELHEPHLSPPAPAAGAEGARHSSSATSMRLFPINLLKHGKGTRLRTFSQQARDKPGGSELNKPPSTSLSGAVPVQTSHACTMPTICRCRSHIGL